MKTTESSRSTSSLKLFRSMLCFFSVVVAAAGFSSVKAMNACGNGDPEKVDVVVVGAGLAGLFAAAKIDEADISYKVLEASSVLGGRFQSEKTDFTNDKNEQLTLELGANFMLGKRRNNVSARSNPMLELMEGYNYSFIDYELLGSIDAYKLNGRNIAEKNILNQEKRLSKIIRKCFDKSGDDFETQYYYPNRFDEDEKLDKNVFQVLSECSTNYEFDDEVRLGLANHFIIQETGFPLNETSRATFPETSFDAFSNEAFFPNDVRGSSELVKEFAENHVNDANIVFNANVTSVKNYNVAGESTTTTAVITNENGSPCTQTYESLYTIVTSSINVLRSGAIEFEDDMVPVLDSHPLVLNKVEKLWIQFDEVFWDIEKDFLLVTQPVGDASGAATFFYNYEKSHPGSKMLMTFVGNEQFDQMEANGGFSVEAVLSGLLELPSYDESNKYITKQTDWRGNANTRGAWEQWQLGKTYEDWYDAFGPLTNLHLTGSAHCLEYWGFTWGAIIHGIYNGEFVVNRLLYPDETLDNQEPYTPCDADAGFKKELGRFYDGNRHLFQPKQKF